MWLFSRLSGVRCGVEGWGEGLLVCWVGKGREGKGREVVGEEDSRV